MMKYLNYLSPTLLFAYVIRLLAHGASIGDSIALAALAGLFGFYYFLEANKEEPVNESVKKELAQMRADLVEMKSTVQALKLGNSFTTKR